MNVWNDTALLGLYTLSPTHCGTGQTTGAVDLPIARDATTGIPVLPATGIKGVLRDYAGAALGKDAIEVLFGKELKAPGREDESDRENKAESLTAGRLAFTEARLLAYPVRSLNRGFLHVTCPLILDALARDLQAVGSEALLAIPEIPDEGQTGAMVADPALAGDPALVLEDMVFAGRELAFSKTAETLAKNLAELIPSDEQATRNRFEKGLVLIPDREFCALMQYAIPVQARIKLGKNKTTDDGGNLWYEERLPSDCLFVAFIGERRRRENGGEPNAATKEGLQDLLRARDAFKVMQIGGNETVGNGLCRCTLLPASSAQEGAAR